MYLPKPPMPPSTPGPTVEPPITVAQPSRLWVRLASRQPRLETGGTPTGPTAGTAVPRSQSWRLCRRTAFPGNGARLRLGSRYPRNAAEPSPFQRITLLWTTDCAVQDENTPSLHLSITPLLPHSTTPPLQNSTTPPLHHSHTPLLHHSTTPILTYSNTQALPYSTTQILNRSSTPPPIYSTTPLLNYSDTPPIPHSPTPGTTGTPV